MARRREAVARALITIGGQVLCCQGRGETFYHLPGGHVEAGEAPADALIRELREELGRDVADLRPLGTLENIFDQGGDTIVETNHLFAVKLFPMAQEEPPQAKESHLTFKWVAIADLPRERLLPPAVYPVIVQQGGA